MPDTHYIDDLSTSTQVFTAICGASVHRTHVRTDYAPDPTCAKCLDLITALNDEALDNIEEEGIVRRQLAASQLRKASV